MTKSSFIAMGDVHLDDLIWKRHREITGDSRLAFSTLVDRAIKHRIPLVIIGDLFDSSEPDPRLVRFFREEMVRCEKVDVPVYALQGNHDKRHGTPWYCACSPWPIHIGDGKPVTINGVRCVGFDYAVRDVIQQQLADLSARIDAGEPAPEVLFLHQAVRQALRFEGAHNCDLDWIHPKIPLTVLGDIHKTIEMPTPGGRAFYTGGSHPRSLEEIGPKSYLWVVRNNDHDNPGGLKVVQEPLHGRFFYKVVWTATDEVDTLKLIGDVISSDVVNGVLREEGKQALQPVVWVRYDLERSQQARELIERLRVEKAIVVDDPMVVRTKAEFDAEKVDTSDLPQLPDLLARVVNPESDRFAYQMALALMDPTTNTVDLIREQRDRFMASFGKPK